MQMEASFVKPGRGQVVEMKKILIFACFISLTMAMTSDELYQKFTKHMKGTAEKCAKEMGLGKDIVDRFVTERCSKDVKPMGCLKACVMKKLGQIVNGKISLDDLNDLTDAVVGDESEMTGKCYEVQEICVNQLKHLKNDCKLALEFFNCASARADDIV